MQTLVANFNNVDIFRCFMKIVLYFSDISVDSNVHLQQIRIIKHITIEDDKIWYFSVLSDYQTKQYKVITDNINQCTFNQFYVIYLFTNFTKRQTFSSKNVSYAYNSSFWLYNITNTSTKKIFIAIHYKQLLVLYTYDTKELY